MAQRNTVKEKGRSEERKNNRLLVVRPGEVVVFFPSSLFQLYLVSVRDIYG